MNRRQFIQTVVLSGCATMVQPILSYQKPSLEDEIYDCIRTCIDYLHNEYKMPFNEYKTPFLFTYYVPDNIISECRNKKYDIKHNIISKYNCNIEFNSLPIENGKCSIEKRCNMLIDGHYMTFLLNNNCSTVMDFYDTIIGSDCRALY